MSDITIRRFADLPWTEDQPTGAADKARLEMARTSGYKHKRLLKGEGDTYLNYIEMGPDFEVAPHSHNAREVIHVLGGSLTPHGTATTLTAGDSLVVPSGSSYGFKCGSEGVRFIVMRPADAEIAYDS